MYQSWVDASRINRGKDRDIWAVDFTAHPLLDPDFPRKRSRLLHLTRLTYRRIIRDDEAYRRELSRLFNPLDSDLEADSLPRLQERVVEYLEEADTYIASTIALLPEASRPAVLLNPLVADCNDVRELMGMTFHGDSERIRYEARRKLFLAEALLHIDQSRTIQEGPRHRTHFEQLLNDGLWKHTQQIHDLQIGFHINPDGHTIQYTTRPTEKDQIWDFRSTFVQKPLGGRNIGLDVLYYNCRFKLAVTPISFEIVDGSRRVLEKVRWGEMRQQSSGSVLSKMIRKGMNNPEEIGDLIGAMFIVNDNEALNDLLILLDSCIGTPFGWRNVTDTLADRPNGTALNTYSSKEFKVFKGDMDILIDEPGGGAPYRFPVEIQIFTLESYLRTVCGAHEASHLALKLRQFLFGLVPKIFPRAVYGSKWLELEERG
jgi:hypothetical protein